MSLLLVLIPALLWIATFPFLLIRLGVLNNRFSSRPIVDLYGLYPKLGFGGKRKCPKAQKAKKNSLLQIVILRGETNCLS